MGSDSEDGSTELRERVLLEDAGLKRKVHVGQKPPSCIAWLMARVVGRLQRQNSELDIQKMNNSLEG